MSERSRVRVAMLASGITGRGGIARYTREVLRGLAPRDDLDIVAVLPDGFELDALGLTDRVEALRAPVAGQVTGALWERFRLGPALARRQVDVVLGTKHVLPRTALPTVLTAHDLMAITRPEQFRAAKRLLLPREYAASLREAGTVIAVSDATRRRLEAWDPRMSAKTVVVPNDAIAPELVRAAPERLEIAGWEPFALVVGDLSPRKNLAVLLDVWDTVRAATGLRLLAVGPAGWRSRAVRERLEALEQQGVAAWAPDASDAELRWCYEHAAVVLYPTLEEGFGLPVIEALAFGAPVVASTDPAVVEAGQGLATHVDARDRPAWIAAIESTVRSGRPTRGLDALRVRSWAEIADQTAGVLRRAAGHAE